MSGDYRVKRAYDAASKDDGKRILVDRLWPRGVTKEEAELDGWAKDATPSDDLRKWLHANPEEYSEFVARYDLELEGDAQQAALAQVREVHAKHTVTLITAAKDVAHSHVPVLVKHLEAGA